MTSNLQSRIYSPPQLMGGINSALLGEFVQLVMTGTPVMVLDFRPKPVADTAGLAFVPKHLAEHVFIFDPTDESRTSSLFWDFRTQPSFVLSRLERVVQSLTARQQPTSMAGFGVVLSEVFEHVSKSVSLLDLLWLYDPEHRDNVLESTGMSKEWAQLKPHMSMWNSVFNVRTLQDIFLQNQYFVRNAAAGGCPWDVPIFLCNLNVAEMALGDARWMAEVAIMGRLQALRGAKVIRPLPSVIRNEELRHIESDSAIQAIARYYTNRHGDAFIAQFSGNDVWSHFEDAEHILAYYSVKEVCRDFHLFIIDDDSGFLDYESVVHTTLGPGKQPLGGSIYLTAQHGRPAADPGCSLPRSSVDRSGRDLVQALCQLSRLKWARPNAELLEDSIESTPKSPALLGELVALAFRSSQPVSEGTSTVLFRDRHYDKIAEGQAGQRPVGLIERFGI